MKKRARLQKSVTALLARRSELEATVMAFDEAVKQAAKEGMRDIRNTQQQAPPEEDPAPSSRRTPEDPSEAMETDLVPARLLS